MSEWERGVIQGVGLVLDLTVFGGGCDHEWSMAQKPLANGFTKTTWDCPKCNAHKEVYTKPVPPSLSHDNPSQQLGRDGTDATGSGKGDAS